MAAPAATGALGRNTLQADGGAGVAQATGTLAQEQRQLRGVNQRVARWLYNDA